MQFVGMNTASTADLKSYDYYLVAFSGGKDSIATFLWLKEQGVDMSKVELWHHDVDGREGDTFMDWDSTRAYCSKFAQAFGVKIYYSWKVGGFLGEMLKDNLPTAPTRWENEDGTIGQIGGQGDPGTRRMFPQLTADLGKRWCSAYLKVDVMKRAINNQSRFNGKRTLVLTGERAQESTARAKYATFQPHTTSNTKRTVDQLRPVHGYSEQDVWDMIKRHGVNPHPAYKLGWGRLSCAMCIFGGASQWASVKAVMPERFAKVAALEVEFGKTIDRDRVPVTDKAAAGTAYAGCANKALVAEALNPAWDGQILVDPASWELPAGAFSGETCGPN